MTPAVQINNLNVLRGKNQVIKKLNLSIETGQIVGLLGPSGSGKTTLMRSIMGIQRHVEGSILIFGSPAGARELVTKVAYDTQSSSVFDDLTVQENLDYMRSVFGLDKQIVKETIASVGLAGFEKRYVRQLSGGQRNRVSLAMALLVNPEVLILDEPTVGLDPVLRNELWGMFRKLANQGKTLIVSSHVMDEAERCDSLVFMRDGEIIANGTLPDILLSTGTTGAEEAFLSLALRKDS